VAINTEGLKKRKEFVGDINNINIDDFEKYIINNWKMKISEISEKPYELLKNEENFTSDKDWMYFSSNPEFLVEKSEFKYYDVVFIRKSTT